MTDLLRRHAGASCRSPLEHGTERVCRRRQCVYRRRRRLPADLGVVRASRRCVTPAVDGPPALLLRPSHGLSYDEGAGARGLNTPLVGTRLRRAARVPIFKENLARYGNA